MPRSHLLCAWCSDIVTSVCENGICEACHIRDQVCGPRCERCNRAHVPTERLNHQSVCADCLKLFRPDFSQHFPPLEAGQRLSGHSRDHVRITTVHDGRFWYADSLAHRTHWQSQRLASLEVEVCAVRGGRVRAIDQTVKRWGAGLGTDGSLPETGFELRTAPAAGDFLVAQLRQLDEAFTYQRAYVNNRAGMHCHIDCRDFNYVTAAHFVRFYARLERALYLLAGPGRAFNRFSHPCGARFETRLAHHHNSLAPARIAAGNAFHQDLYGTNVTSQSLAESRANLGRARAAHDHERRYRGLNVHSWMYRGTMEVRIHPAETRGWAMLGWAQLMVSLADLVVTNPAIVDEFAPAVSFVTHPLLRADSLLDSVATLQKLCAYLPAQVVAYINRRWQDIYHNQNRGYDDRAYVPMAQGDAGHQIYAEEPVPTSHQSLPSLEFWRAMGTVTFTGGQPSLADRLQARRAA